MSYTPTDPINETLTNGAAKTKLTGPDGTEAAVLTAAPGSDTGQAAIAVRVISQLGAGAGGGDGSGLTDTQLRAAPVPVSGTFWQATQPVSGSFYQATQPVSAAALPLPSGASTEATLAAIKAKTDNLDVLLSTRTKAADQQHVIVDSSSSVAVTGTFWQATQPVSIAASVAVTGPLTDTQIRATPLPVSGTVTVGNASLAVTGAFFQATQPVSAAALPLPAGASTAAKQPALGTAGTASVDVLTVQGIASMTALKVDGSGVTQPVSGTFWQATQPVSGTVTANAGSGTMAVSGPLTDTQLRAVAVPVSGTFWQATQPVSIAASVAVTGPLTDTQLRAVAVPVSGTFFQATQPISAAALPLPTGAALDATLTGGTQQAQLKSGTKGSSTAALVTSVSVDANTQALHANITNFPASQAVTGTFWQATQPVSGTFFQATQPVSIAASVAVTGPVTDTQIRATPLPVSGTVTANAGTGTMAVSGPLTDTQLRATAVPVSQATLTKGTQGATGVSTQDLKDAGRSQILVNWERVAGTANVESALTNFTNASRAGSALGAASSITVTAGKTLRIQSVNVALTSTSTIVNNARIRIRQAGTVANTSPIIWTYDIPWPIGGTVAANQGTSISIPIPDGLEVAAGQQVSITWITAAATCTISCSIIGYEY